MWTCWPTSRQAVPIWRSLRSSRAADGFPPHSSSIDGPVVEAIVEVFCAVRPTSATQAFEPSTQGIDKRRAVEGLEQDRTVEIGTAITGDHDDRNGGRAQQAQDRLGADATKVHIENHGVEMSGGDQG